MALPCYTQPMKLFILIVVLLLSACKKDAQEPQIPPQEEPVKTLVARWKEPLWSQWVYDALPGEMIAVDPKDIKDFCGNYPSSEDGRKRFWVYLVSAMAERESGHDPKNSYKESFKDAKGRYVVSRGLLQISIESANAYGCGFKDEQELHDPKRNLECSVKILSRWVIRDGRIAGKESGWRGGARYWSVLRSSSSSYGKITGWTKAYCQ